jgi:hypothetical protein
MTAALRSEATVFALLTTVEVLSEIRNEALARVKCASTPENANQVLQL